MGKLKLISNTNCCVYGCHTKRGRERTLSFHYFPKEKSGYVFLTNKLGLQEKVDKKKAWELKLLMGKPTTPAMRVCSLHFKKNDFILPDFSTKRPRLKKDAVPSQNLPMRRFNTYKSKDRSARKLVDQKTDPSYSGFSLYKCEENAELIANVDAIENRLHNLSQKEKMAIKCLLQFENAGKNKAEKATQVKSGDIVLPFINCIDSDIKLRSLTGLPSFVMWETLVKGVNEYFPDLRVHKLSTKERIIMTLMKLKTGLRYVALAALFSLVTGKTCKVIFHDMIPKLAAVLKPLIMWPSSEECRSNLPKCFEAFSSVRVVLDCTELPIQKCKRLCCRILTYSHYKGSQTVKFMTGVSPAGLITFISRAYGGRTSDKAIFEQSSIIEKLEFGKDAVMVDKGFLIDDITNVYRIKLIRPPFLKKMNQFTEQEAMYNVEIAKARVHIERTNQRIKSFEIFTKSLPISLVPAIENIFTVICAIVNLSTPILGDDKFL